MRQPKQTDDTDKYRKYRARLLAHGRRVVAVALPVATLDLLDELQHRHGLKNRSDALVRLLEERSQTATRSTA